MSGDHEERVRIDFKDGVADVRLARPEKMNAIDTAMFAALSEAGHELATRRDLRAVVLSGEGRAFCAGLDFTSFQAMAGGERKAEESADRSLLQRDPESAANFAQSPAWVWQELPVPVIAAVHGVAYGGGLQIALGADIRFVAPDARLSVREVHWGLVPDMSLTQTLRNLVPLDVAKELTFTGRVFSGTDAKELGLATHVSETPHEAALELAREIAGRSPDAVRASKQLLNAAWHGPEADGLKLEETTQRGLIGRGNQIEAVRSNMEKRPPRFEDPS
ncbi:MAG: crotonase/enoyl-CoA hydratase family protein [Myxococcota bacterium]|nr:crotonase/enoyl-CoA hydratase family protein [Myxococcota bacterium]